MKDRIELSEQQLVKTPEQLQGMINKVLKQGLEGLVCKHVTSVYEPNARHWLKIKKASATSSKVMRADGIFPGLSSRNGRYDGFDRIGRVLWNGCHGWAHVRVFDGRLRRNRPEIQNSLQGKLKTLSSSVIIADHVDFVGGKWAR